MNDKLRSFPGSTLFHIAILATVSTAVLLRYGLSEQPILGDRAYFVYVSQAVSKGDLLYGSTTFGYTPYGPFLSAMTMHIGDIFNVPSYLAPRYLSLPVYAASAALLYLVARNASGSALAGIFSGLTLSGFGAMSVLCASNLEPKAMVMFFMLASMLALQKRNWLVTGFASAMAGMFWQPAAIAGLSMFMILAFTDRDKLLPNFLKFSAGMLLGMLPAILYLTAFAEWHNFYEMAVVRKAALSLPDAASTPFKWMAKGFKAYRSEGFVFFSALAGFSYFMIKNGRKTFNALTDRKDGGMLILTLAWFLFNGIEFNGAPDLIPMLPLMAYWSSLFAARLIEGVSFLAGRIASNRFVLLTGFIFVNGLLFTDAITYNLPSTLTEQRLLVESVMGKADRRFIALNAEEFYVLSEKKSPLRYTRMERWVDTVIEMTEPGGSDGFIKRLEESMPPLVIIKKRKSANLKRIENELLAGYDVTVYNKIPKHNVEKRKSHEDLYVYEKRP